MPTCDGPRRRTRTPIRCDLAQTFVNYSSFDVLHEPTGINVQIGDDQWGAAHPHRFPIRR